MNIKEHLQFLVLMIPTLLLLIAAIITLASPPASARTYQATGSEPEARLALGVVETEADSLSAFAAR